MEETEYEREQRLREEKDLEEQIMVMKGIVEAVESVLSRQRKCKDPVVRYSLFVDKLLTILDVGMGMFKGLTDDEKYPLELRTKINNLALTLQQDLADLMDWIQQPIYGPDHPYGNRMMRSSMNDFTMNKESKSESEFH